MYLKDNLSEAEGIGFSSMPVLHRSAEIAVGIDSILQGANKKTCPDCGHKYSGGHMCSKRK